MWLQFLFLVLIALQLQCKAGNFTGKSATKSASTPTPTPKNPDDDDDDNVVAQEPTPIGGAYLACFIDPQLDPSLLPEAASNKLLIGCQSFADADFQQTKAMSGVTLLSAASEKLPQQKLAVLPLNNHPRWSWLILLPAEAIGGKFYLRLKEGDKAAIRMRVDMLDILPVGLTTAAALKGGRFLLRVRGTQTCISGDPIWSWDTAINKPITPQLVSGACESALRFGFDVFETGFRMFTPNPKPYACDTQNYVVEHCQDSCVDLEDYGRGARLTLFACTKSVEAQRHNFVPAAGGSFRLRTNGRFLFLQEGKTVATADSTVMLELVPQP